jgi:predicted acylesterase/phospholipase RssA
MTDEPHRVSTDPDARIGRRPTRRQLLALSGGGFRGLFTARVLERAEEAFQTRIGACFDLVAGTSVGALIAAAVAQGIPARAIRETFEANGEKIFRPGLWAGLRRIVRAPYRADAISATLDALFASHPAALDAPLAQQPLKLLVTAVDAAAHRARVIGGKGLGDGALPSITLRDAILASAAAPTYFPVRRIASGETLVDGGLVANAPEWIALAYGLRLLATPLEDLHLLGIGTAAPDPARATAGDPDRGILPWLLSKRGLVQLTLDSQEELAVRQVMALLSDRYVRVDMRPSPDQARYIALDRADADARRVLITLADAAFEVFRERAAFGAYFRRA